MGSRSILRSRHAPAQHHSLIFSARTTNTSTEVKGTEIPFTSVLLSFKRWAFLWLAVPFTRFYQGKLVPHK
jgi:hypothetical protein